MNYPLQIGDQVLDFRPIYPLDPTSTEHYPGIPGKITHTSDVGFKVHWEGQDERLPYEHGYSWSYLKEGIRKID